MTDLEQLEASLNIVTYLRKYDEYYRGANFCIIQVHTDDWRIELTTELLDIKLNTYKEAFSYAMGYIDGCIEDMGDSGDYE